MSDRFTTSDGLAIAFQRWGQSNPGPVVVLHHGFAASASSNWETPGVVQAFIEAGRSVLAVDARGHGASDKPHDVSLYGEARLRSRGRRIPQSLIDLQTGPPTCQ